MKGRDYIVVEMSGMVGEQDVGRFGTHDAAYSYIQKAYSKNERDRSHRNCLFPDICVEVDGVRSYDI